MKRKIIFAFLCMFFSFESHAQLVTTLRASELRNDKLPSASVMTMLATGAQVKLISIEGGWANVLFDSSQGSLSGWLRASAINLTSVNSIAAGMASGRLMAANSVLTLGVRGMRDLPPRINRHALIIGISKYADPRTSALPGARIDKVSATQMANAMQVPDGNITYLQDEQATGDNIRKAIRDLNDKVLDGDRVFIHFSGHGTRYNDPAVGGCVEALLAYDGGQSGMITNREMTSLLQSITGKTDKLFVMYDACHSGGLVNIPAMMRSRGVPNANDEGVLRPKFAAVSDECSRPVNVKTRNLTIELTDKGTLPQDVIHISAARENEISFDDEQKGGLATQFVRDCMLRDYVDLDKSGAISMDEIRQCAQEKINKRMQHDANYKAHNLMLSGNLGFVPAWFSQPQVPVALVKPTVSFGTNPVVNITPVIPAPSAQLPNSAIVAVSPVATPTNPQSNPPKPTLPVIQTLPDNPIPVAAVPLVVSPVALTGEQALRQMYEQRDGKRQVQIKLDKTQFVIKKDKLNMSITSGKSGYVYVAIAGSDNKAVDVLFPNGIDQDNKIYANKSLDLPRANWRVGINGPVGTDHILVLVTDGPRDLSQLTITKDNPFFSSLNDTEGRTKLGVLMSASQSTSSIACQNKITRKTNPQCSDAYGAAMVSIEEQK